jgi:hypothetical protein
VRPVKAKPIIYSVITVIGAAVVYRHLASGGWLTQSYQLGDPNVVNLVLAIFEPIALLVVIAYWIWPTQFLRRLLFIFFILQLLVGAGFVAFFLFFFATWKPKMM